jgi:hypothetical protein
VGIADFAAIGADGGLLMISGHMLRETVIATLERFPHSNKGGIRQWQRWTFEW